MRILLIFLFVGGLLGEISSKEVEVCKTCPITTLKAAFSIIDTGDVIVLHKGEYKEHDLEVFVPFSLVGKDDPVINGEMVGTILSVSTDNFSIEGVTFRNVGQSYTKDFAAVIVSRGSHFVIKDNTFENMFFGILLEKSHFGEIRNNLIWGTRKGEANSGNGVQAWHSSDLEVSNNEVYGMRDGLYFEFVSNSVAYENLSYDNIRYGLHFMFSNDDEYHHNIFRNNGAGVAVMFSKKILMHNNRFEFNWGAASYGLLLKEIYDAEIYNNLFEQNTTGITTEGSTRINFTNNIFLRNGWAVKVTGGCYDNMFFKNDFSHNAFDLSFNGHLNGSSFENNYWSDYTGYDLDRNGLGDVPYRPVKLFSYIVNRTPETIVLLRSLFVDMINFSEKVSPVFTPDDLIDNMPIMKRPVIEIGIETIDF
jgi:nitrous oxidase accessory protein